MPQLRQMIKDSDGDQFENLLTMQQELTFSSAETAFARYGVKFGKENLLHLVCVMCMMIIIQTLLCYYQINANTQLK